MIDRNEIVRIAREHMDVPYRHQGRSADTGVDCAGLLVLIADRLGINYIDSLRYTKNPETFNLKPELDKELTPIMTSNMLPGDIMLMKIDIEPQHVVIVGDYQHGGLSMIHCYSNVGKVVEHRLSKMWESRIVQAYQIPGVPETWEPV